MFLSSQIFISGYGWLYPYLLDIEEYVTEKTPTYGAVQSESKTKIDTTKTHQNNARARSSHNPLCLEIARLHSIC